MRVLRAVLVLEALALASCNVASREKPPMVDMACNLSCSADHRSVVQCDGIIWAPCGADQTCDDKTASCTTACQDAIARQSSVGCEYYATQMELAGIREDQKNPCYAVFLANTFGAPARISVELGGAALPVKTFTRIPRGSGPSLSYLPYDDQTGIPPGEVAILFLAGIQGAAPACPAPSAAGPTAMIKGTGIGRSFRITSDVPVVAYQMHPYGGGSAAVTGASLLLPTSTWDTNYVAVTAAQAFLNVAYPSINIIAQEDRTTVTLRPRSGIVGGGGLPASDVGMPITFSLNRGEHAQFSQPAELVGSIINSDKPVGLMGGHACMQVPLRTQWCDHAEQMIPPVRALGHEYVAVMHKPRGSEPGIWRIIGAVNDTMLDYSSEVGGPKLLRKGQMVEFQTPEPFVVSSQDADHPFLLFGLMSGSKWTPIGGATGLGDPDFVLIVPPKQFGSEYVFFADPTYSETSLVLIRARQTTNEFFSDVKLDCADDISDWKPVGNRHEWTRVSLSTGDFQNVGRCSTGRHTIKSEGPFGLWVWGWGGMTSSFPTNDVSYAYPGGSNIQAINQIVIQ